MTKSIVKDPWFQLGIAVFAQFVGGIVVITPAYLIPVLSSEFGISLAQVGTIASMPSLGMVFFLLVWGSLADRFGERLVLNLGFAMAVVICMAALVATDPLMLTICFLLGGGAVSSFNVAAGRLIMAWIPKKRRGLAMGMRFMSSSVAMAFAAITLPHLASTGGIRTALLLPLAFIVAGLVVCLIFLREPPRFPKPRINSAVTPDEPPQLNPYRMSWYLQRVHAVSALLTFPQLTLQTFSLIFLITELGWSPVAAGWLIAAAQIFVAFSRLFSGHISDVIGRLRLVRLVAFALSGVLLMLALSTALGWSVVTAVLLVAASTLASSYNSPAFTAVAEYAGPRWTGRALGVQNTAQNISAFAVGPVAGGLIATLGYPLTFVLLTLAPVSSVLIVPRVDVEHPANEIEKPLE